MSEIMKNDRNGKPKQGTDNVLSITVLAAPSVLTFVSQETLRYDDQGLETGGILVGIWLDQDTCYLVGATGSGPMAEHAQYSFAVDTDYANNELNRIRQSFPGSDYVGEWHKHPATLERPSQGDLMTARQLLADPDYPIRLINPIMTVKNHKALFHLFYLDRDLPDFVRLQEHGHIEAENDDEPWDDGSAIYHANIVLVPKNKPARQTAPAPAPSPSPSPNTPNKPVQPVPASLLDVPSPFTGEASDIDSNTIKKYSKMFDTMPPARLSSTYQGYPEAGPRSKSKEPLFDPVPPARLSPDYNPANYKPFPPQAAGPVQPPSPPAAARPASNQPGGLDEEDKPIAMHQVSPEKTVAMRQPAAGQPLSHPAQPVGISPTLILIVGGLILLLIILVAVLLLTR